jgi:hypothetical protein
MAHDTMKTRRKLLPGQPGTKQLVKLYGDRLVCVRYRYNCEQQRRIKTVELIIDDAEWHPDPSRIPPHKRVALKVAYGERAVADVIKSAGGRWNRSQRVWELAYKEVVALGLTDRMVTREGDNAT